MAETEEHVKRSVLNLYFYGTCVAALLTSLTVCNWIDIARLGKAVNELRAVNETERKEGLVMSQKELLKESRAVSIVTYLWEKEMEDFVEVFGSEEGVTQDEIGSHIFEDLYALNDLLSIGLVVDPEAEAILQRGGYGSASQGN